VKDEGMAPEFALPSAIGFIAGGITAVAVWGLYPPTKGHVWPMWTLTLGSTALLLIVYLSAHRLGAVRAGESLVVGYGLALVLAASLVLTRELVNLITNHVPENLGVKRVDVSRVEASG
jgi:hypothetical protein